MHHTVHINLKKAARAVLLLAAALFVFLLTAGPVRAEDNYGICVGGKWITAANEDDVLGDGKVSYDPASSTLTLNNAAICAKPVLYAPDDDDGNCAAIYCGYAGPESLTIVLNGSSTMTSDSSACGQDYLAGIIMLCEELDIKGTGSLKIDFSDASNEPLICSYGIYSPYECDIEDVSLNINIKTSTATPFGLAFDDGSLDKANVSITVISDCDAKGISTSDSFNIENSKVTVITNAGTMTGYGIDQSDLLNIVDSTLKVNVTTKDENAVGVSGLSFLISSSEITVKVKGKGETASTGIKTEGCEIYGSSTVSSVVSADGGEGYGIEGPVAVNDKAGLTAAGNAAFSQKPNLSDRTATGAIMVSSDRSGSGAVKWDNSKTLSDPSYKYVEIPGGGASSTPSTPTAPAGPASSVPMFRLYNPNSGEHFYTAKARERDYLASIGWRDEGIGWYAPSTSNTPVYRLYNRNAGDHHYTMKKKERDYLISIGWEDEGIGWYSDDAKGVPLYRQYNPNAKTGTHNYTTRKKENDYLVSIGWREEGIGWYGMQ